jgi:drug/metabolite transporter (DMT)-like permease
MLLFVFLIFPVLIWFLPFMQLKDRPSGTKWFLINFLAMLVSSIIAGFVLNANGLHREAIVALITMLSVVWALFIYLRLRRMG